MNLPLNKLDTCSFQNPHIIWDADPHLDRTNGQPQLIHMLISDDGLRSVAELKFLPLEDVNLMANTGFSTF